MDDYLWISLPYLKKRILIVDKICIAGETESECLAKWNKFKYLKNTPEYEIYQYHLQERLDIWQELEKIQTEYLINKGSLDD